MSEAEKTDETLPPTKSGPHQRSMRNILLRPAFQLKYAFYFVGMTLVTMGAVFLLFLLSLEDMISTLAVVYRIEPEVIGAIQQSLRTATYTTIAVAVLFGAISVSLGIILTHRLVGPMVPIRRLIRQLTEGEYGVQGRLRTKDDYQEVMNDLNALSKKLIERHP
jgi:nitrogen fixation/metabolism regulation signal transduction histidine kinase